MIDYGDFVGLPWVLGGEDASGVDCWGLVILFYREALGIEVPATGSANAFSEVQDPQPHDVAMFETRLMIHAGVILPNEQLLHVQEGHLSKISPAGSWRVGGARRNFRWLP